VAGPVKLRPIGDRRRRRLEVLGIARVDVGAESQAVAVLHVIKASLNFRRTTHGSGSQTESDSTGLDGTNWEAIVGTEQELIHDLSKKRPVDLVGRASLDLATLGLKAHEEPSQIWSPSSAAFHSGWSERISGSARRWLATGWDDLGGNCWDKSWDRRWLATEHRRGTVSASRAQQQRGVGSRAPWPGGSSASRSCPPVCLQRIRWLEVQVTSSGRPRDQFVADFVDCSSAWVRGLYVVKKTGPMA
jgi:hypothetical protein